MKNKNAYVLTIGRYVGVAEEENDGVPFEEKMKELGGELKGNFEEDKNLEKKFFQNLKKINV